MVMIFDSSEALEVLGKDMMKPKTWPTLAILLLFKTFSSWPVSFSTLGCWTLAWKGESRIIPLDRVVKMAPSRLLLLVVVPPPCFKKIMKQARTSRWKVRLDCMIAVRRRALRN